MKRMMFAGCVLVAGLFAGCSSTQTLSPERTCPECFSSHSAEDHARIAGAASKEKCGENCAKACCAKKGDAKACNGQCKDGGKCAKCEGKSSADCKDSKKCADSSECKDKEAKLPCPKCEPGKPCCAKCAEKMTKMNACAGCKDGKVCAKCAA